MREVIIVYDGQKRIFLRFFLDAGMMQIEPWIWFPGAAIRFMGIFEVSLEGTG